MRRFFFNIMVTALVFMVLSSCDRYYDGYYDDIHHSTSTGFLNLKNYSSEATVWFIPDAETAGNLPSELSEWQKIDVYEVAPQSSVCLTFDSEDNYVTPVETYGIGDRMEIYVFKKDVWDNYGWAEIVAGRMWCGRFSLSVEEARELNGTVTYPTR